MRIDRLGAEGALEIAGAVLRVYCNAWNNTPFTENAERARDFEANFQLHTERDDFRMFAAISGEETLQGFAYGYTSESEGWWREMVMASLHPSVAGHWFSDALEVVELAVVPAAQRHGLGAALHDALITSAGNRTAVLSTQTGNVGARRLYAARGWKVILEDFYFPNRRDPYVIMGKDLQAPGP